MAGLDFNGASPSPLRHQKIGSVEAGVRGVSISTNEA
jgi:hypothetical protein